MHLKPEDLVDLAEGAARDTAFPHLAACAACRQQLSELRATMTTMTTMTAIDREVPEPPPFFWDRLQHRIVDAVAADGERSVASRIFASLWPRAALPITALAAVMLLAIVFNVRRDRVGKVVQAPSRAAAGMTTPGPIELSSDTLDDDPSLQLVADLASGLDAAAASEAGLAPTGSADHALTHMSAAELQELKQLLRAELGT